ncbi:hypothetical protein PHYBOEH_005432 [Phytophthora boehmeriae]|uniref:RxLR effector protein n=1 Tax=Phytophthora boehmeriae TaxID=109152 RepID=A0A8T1WPJ5_9STRA|nr:hypothetical protein PHYBOEH_005432 [Phytophthora boehmeriae]
MRLGYFVLLIASTCLSVCDAAPPITGKTLSLDPSSDSIPSANRFLRIHRAVDAEDSERDADGEERGLSGLKKLFGFKTKEIDAFADETLTQMVKSKRFKKKVFKQWDNLSVGQIRQTLNMETNRWTKQKLLVEYLNKKPVKKIKPKKNRKVTFARV